MDISGIRPSAQPSMPMSGSGVGDADTKIQALKRQLQQLNQEKQKAVQNKDEDARRKVEKEIQAIEKEIQRLKQEKIMKIPSAPALPDGIEEKIKSVERSEMAFDPALVGQLIEKIIVRNAKRVVVVFKSGLVENAILEDE